MAKILRVFLENLFEYYFLNIIVSVNFFSDLKFEYYCEYYPEILLQLSFKKKKKKLIGGAIKFFLKNYWAMKHLGYGFLGYEFFFQKFVKSSGPPPA